MKKINIDSRTLKKGEFFWPIKGENFDGHDFIEKAIKKECSGFVYSEPLDPSILALAKSKNIQAIKVADTLQALGEEAKKIRQKLNPQIIAITGSNGKTTTKEIVGQILARKYPTVYPQKSFNNLIGLPLTLLSINQDTKYVVLEMGMNQPGEIRQLMHIAQPDMGVIVNILNTHIGNFDSQEDIVRAKGEMAENLGQNKTLILNEDCLQYAFFKQKFACQIKTFGLNQNNFCILKQARQQGDKLHVYIILNEQTYEFVYPGLGLHNAQNVTGAVACLYELGLAPEEIQKELPSITTPYMRMQKINLNNNIILYDDTFNASPASTKAAIDTFDTFVCKGKKYFIFGDMLELGKHSPSLHTEIGQQLAKSTIEFIYTYGKETKYTHQVLQNSTKKARHFKNKTELTQTLKANLQPNDLLLIKGSKGMKMGEIVLDLRNIFT